MSIYSSWAINSATENVIHISIWACSCPLTLWANPKILTHPIENTPRKLTQKVIIIFLNSWTEEKQHFFQECCSEQRKMENDEENEVNNFLGWAAELGISDSPLNLNNPFDHSSCLGHSLCVSHFPNAGG